jgi:hypothetical protein
VFVNGKSAERKIPGIGPLVARMKAALSGDESCMDFGDWRAQPELMTAEFRYRTVMIPPISNSMTPASASD